MRGLLDPFWSWYERYYTLNLTIATSLFLLQLTHLYWLTTDVVFGRLFGVVLFDPKGISELLLILVDYIEIPALISISVLYLNDLKKRFNWKNVWLLIFVNSQWLHLYWITDEFIIKQLGEPQVSSALPSWPVWVAILIDYLEIPAIFDTSRKLYLRIKARYEQTS